MTDHVQTLVVDDEERICFYLKDTLERVGHIVTTASSGEEALEILRDGRFDLTLLDLRLGGRVDGMQVLEAVRWRWPATAVVILTAHGTLETAVDAIRQEVDGYLLKPVEPTEVRRAAQEALERRRRMIRADQRRADERVLEEGPFVIDLEAHVAQLGGAELELTPQEFDLLVHLIQSAPRVIGPPELVQVVRKYKPESMYEARQIIKWYIHRLRRKVESEPANPRYIINVRGVGYGYTGGDRR
jgi:two-component system, OmpR family, alkaline phosphatase synthesis response regulator PhoP